MSPEDMLASLIVPQMAAWGVTRLADITGLDFLGIPVAVAVKPLGEPALLAAAGPTAAAARVSAALAAAELWHADSSVPEPVATGSLAQIRPGYRLSHLRQPPDCLVTELTELDWVKARSIVDGWSSIVPRDLVSLSRPPRRRWRAASLAATSRGLGAAATRDDAEIKAMCDWAANDAAARLAQSGIAGILDSRTIPDGWCAGAVQQVARAGGNMVIAAVPSRTGLPCWAVALRIDGVETTGIAVRPGPEAALTAAICEAAVSRLAALTGAPPVLPAGAAPREGPPRSWDGLVGHGDLGDLMNITGRTLAVAVARRLLAATGAMPLAVDLAGEEEIAVVKVLCPDPRGAKARR